MSSFREWLGGGISDLPTRSQRYMFVKTVMLIIMLVIIVVAVVVKAV